MGTHARWAPSSDAHGVATVNQLSGYPIGVGEDWDSPEVRENAKRLPADDSTVMRVPRQTGFPIVTGGSV